MVIDKLFILKWSEKYLEASREIDIGYQSLIQRTAMELGDSESISFDLFIDIVIWKSERVKSIVRTHVEEIGFEPYSDAIQILYAKKDVRYLPFLASLYGINYPTASAIGHFVCPTVYPIIDYRVVECLIYLKQLPKKNTSFYTTTSKGYSEFFSKIHQIVAPMQNISLRQLDEALFMFHKSQKITLN